MEQKLKEDRENLDVGKKNKYSDYAAFPSLYFLVIIISIAFCAVHCCHCIVDVG